MKIAFVFHSLMLQKFLLAIDFSETSANLIEFAFEFNKHFFAQLHFIHVFTLPYAVAEDDDGSLMQYDTIKKSYIDRIWSFIDQYKGDYHYDMMVHASSGGVVQEIEDYVRDQEIDLLIIGNKERSRWGRWISGSITQHFLQKPPTHVLSITTGYKQKEWKRLWVCTDLSMPLTDDQIYSLKFLADQLKTDLRFLHITDATEKPLEYDVESKTSIYKAFQQEPIIIPIEKNIPQTIEHIVRKEGGDALILFPHHHHWLDSFFLGHETTAISSEIDIPIISMKGSER